MGIRVRVLPREHIRINTSQPTTITTDLIVVVLNVARSPGQRDTPRRRHSQSAHRTSSHTTNIIRRQRTRHLSTDTALVTDNHILRTNKGEFIHPLQRRIRLNRGPPIPISKNLIPIVLTIKRRPRNRRHPTNRRRNTHTRLSTCVLSRYRCCVQH